MGKTLRRSSNIYKTIGVWTEYTQEGDDEALLGVCNRSDKRTRLSREVTQDCEYGVSYEDRDKVILLVGGND